MKAFSLLLVFLLSCATLSPDEFTLGYGRDYGEIDHPLADPPWRLPDQDYMTQRGWLTFTWYLGGQREAQDAAIRTAEVLEREELRSGHEPTVVVAGEAVSTPYTQKDVSQEQVVSGIPMVVWISIAGLITALGGYLFRRPIADGAKSLRRMAGRR